ncbi:MAG: hypothetical protein ACI4GC_03240 [Acutalibacteraceae bacterium]
MKKLLFLLIIISSAFVFSFDVHCESELDTFKDELEESFFSSLDGESYDVLKKQGIDSFDGEGIVDGAFESLKQYFSETFTDKFKQSVTWFFVMLCVLCVISLFQGVYSFSQGSDLLNFLSIVVLTIVFTDRFSSLLSAVVSASKITGSFILAFVPTFTLLVSFSGNPASALTYNTLVLGVSEMFSLFLSSGFISFVGVYFSLIISFSFNSAINLNRFISAVNRFVNLILGFFTSVFVSFFTLKNVFTSTADTVTSKGTKFLLSSLIPVVGSSISEAYSALNGSINLLKSSFGILGITAVIIINIPVFTEGVVCYLMLCILSAVGEILGLNRAGELLRGFSCCVRCTLLAALLQAFIFVISAGIMITLKGS